MKRFIFTSALTFGLAAAALGNVAYAHGDKPSFKLRFIGEATFPTGFLYEGTVVGGLSGIDYNKYKNVYYAIADDRSSAARFYSLTINLSDGALQNSDVQFRSVTTLLDKTGAPFAANSLDPESIRFSPISRTLYWTSEGDANQLLPPFVRQMTLDGKFIRELTTPQKYFPVSGGTAGIRNNLAFENLSFSVDMKSIYTATENALAQDGPAASRADQSPSRVLELSLRDGKAKDEHIYKTETVAAEPVPAGSFSTNGLVEILAYGEDEFLTLERSFSTGVGNAVRIYKTTLEGASNVKKLDSIAGMKVRSMKKELVLDLATLGITLDNLEGMTFGPRLPNGDHSLILVSDNNFSATQFTQFLAFAIEEKKRHYAEYDGHR